MKLTRLRRRHALLLVLALASAAYASVAVSPAAAARHETRYASSACQFSSVDALTAYGSAARGDVAREPAFNDFAAEVPANAKSKSGKAFEATIPVYFHVVTPDGVTGNVSDQAIREQINVMNMTFGGFEGGFNTGCNNNGDYVDDTPPQLIATSGCPEGQDSCREPGLDSIHNYMDYSFDSCYSEFTKGQAARIQDAYFFWRA
jgi:pregnancy-associated plasma protein-A